MTVNDSLRLAAGAFVLLSLLLGHLQGPHRHLPTAFVGLNLFQSAFIKWYPLIAGLRRLGFADPELAARAR